MKLRSLLLAGTVLPFAMSYPAEALDRAPKNTIPWQLAQVEEVCPEGEVCPPVEGEQPAVEGEQPAEAPAPAEVAPEPAPAEPAIEAAPLPEETIIQEAPPEQVPPAPEMEAAPPPEETIIQEAPPEQVPPAPEMETAPLPEETIIQEAPPEQVPPAPEMEAAPPPEETIIQEAPPEQVPPAPEMEAAPPPEETIIQEAPPEQVPPAPDMEITPPPEQVPPTPETGTPPAVEETTTEQQLEAQGDDEEAGRVRSLRNRLLEQLQEVLVPSGGPRNRRRGYDNRYDEGDVVDRRGGSSIIDLGGGNIYVEPEVPDDGGRLLYGADNIEVQELEGGRTRTIVYRRNGVQIITLRDRYGDIIRRTKRLPDGREIVLIDNRFPEDYDATEPPILSDVPPPIIGIPRDQYIVDLGVASYDDLRGALLAPPVQQMQRPYTLDEVLRNEQVRAYSPRIDLDTITFEFGSATIGDDQMRSILELGRALEDVLAERPDEVYLIEGHTDLVGGNYDNLILSDRRAEAVAVALSQNFEIPPENLITQGYGEEYPKVDTDGPERRNRRATVRRVTELLQAQNQ